MLESLSGLEPQVEERCYVVVKHILEKLRKCLNIFAGQIKIFILKYKTTVSKHIPIKNDTGFIIVWKILNIAFDNLIIFDNSYFNIQNNK